jgi:phenylacetic acid degradation operon negative regulatory protein
MRQDDLSRATRALLARLRRQKPLRSGSLLVTILGDAIAPRGGAVTLGSLIKLAQPFGLPERLVRTSVGRLAQDGWLSARRAGRQSEYTLTRHGRERFAEATQRIYSEPPRDWDHVWTLLLLAPSRGNDRDRIREEMLWLGFGQLAPGVLAHPSRSAPDTRRLLRDMGIDRHAIILRAHSDGIQQDRQLISAGWNLGELARSYRRFVAGFGEIGATSAADTCTPEQAFVIRTLLIHEYRKIHLRDPLLPHDLLPQDWIGTVAYELCRELYLRVFARAEAYLSTHARRLRGPLQPPSRATRFGE